MVNILDYANKLPYITLKTVNGKSFSGQIICVMDMEETYFDEDSLTIEKKDGELLIFMQSEIERIEVEGNGNAD